MVPISMHKTKYAGLPVTKRIILGILTSSNRFCAVVDVPLYVTDSFDHRYKLLKGQMNMEGYPLLRCARSKKIERALNVCIIGQGAKSSSGGLVSLNPAEKPHREREQSSMALIITLIAPF